MDPNTQTPTPNPYDFLNSTPSPAKRTFLGGGPKDRKLMSVLFVLGVIVLVFIAFSVFQNLTGKNYSTYITLAAKQTELVRIADIGATKARTSIAKNYAATIRQTTQSERAQTLAFLKKKNQKVTEKELTIKKDTATDKSLTAAEQTSTYDEKLINTINTLLLDYQKTVRSLPTTGLTTSEKKLITNLQTDANILVKAPTK